MADRCKACVKRAADLGRKTPIGWEPFAWGPSGEDPQHFYVVGEDVPDPLEGTCQEVPVTRLCEVEPCIKRDVAR